MSTEVDPAPPPEPEPEAAPPAAEEVTPLAILREAQAQALPVEGKVLAQRGSLGLDVDLGGGILALCPMAEVDVRHKENPGKLVGETLKFLVKECGDKDVLLSRRALLEAESSARVAAAKKRAVPGAVLEGKVTSVREFGAFVDIGGLEGLVHVSELGHGRVTDPRTVVKVGETIQVKVLEVKHDPIKGDRISLSRKACEPSAFDEAVAPLQEGQKIKGKVARLSTFGAFVEVAPGVTGLVHVSALSPLPVAQPGDVVKPGEEIEVVVLGIDRDKKRLSLGRVPSEAEVAAAAADQEVRREEKREKRREAKERKALAKLKPHERLKPGQVVQATVDRIEPYGLFVKIAGGGRGMIHVSESGVAKGEALDKALPAGTKLEAVVLEVATDPTPRIRLSRAAVAAVAAGQNVESYLAEKALLAAAERPPPARRTGKARPPRPAGAAAERSAGAAAGPAEPRRERRRERPREGGAPSQPKPGGLGTLGDLFKAKLAQKKP
ncbi:MAG: S1 RNA-binding domain-containing protein [Myxococcales bacterium]